MGVPYAIKINKIFVITYYLTLSSFRYRKRNKGRLAYTIIIKIQIFRKVSPKSRNLCILPEIQSIYGKKISVSF